MTTTQRLAWIALIIALALWLGALLSAGVAAGFTFATLPRLEITLGEFESFRPGDHAAHGRLAAGIVLEKVFTTVDFAQFSLGFIAVVILLLQFLLWRYPIRRMSNLLRATAIGLAVLLTSYHIFLQAPAMNMELQRYWAAARGGDEAAAVEHRARFDLLHPRAEFILRANLILILIGLTASVAAMLPPPRTPAAQATAGRTPELEEPLLSRTRS